MLHTKVAIAPLTFCLASILAIGCGAQSPPPPSPAPSAAPAAGNSTAPWATVTAVAAIPQTDEGYTFTVTVQSPDTGCDQYANWWEVVSEEGDLLYRRILAHSHGDEQPFERAGGPVAIAPDQTVIVRAHMYPDGYGTQAMQGSPNQGFQTTTLPADFAVELADVDPQPNHCAF